MRPSETLFYDVDTQRDFILPDGKLSIPGTDRIVGNLAEITLLARGLGIRVVASVDSHSLEDPELQRNGGEFPDHCISGTDGQQKINETAPLDPMVIAARELSDDEISAAIAHPGEIILEKNRFDVFEGNPSTHKLLPRILAEIKHVVVYGVYTEVCVRDALRGLVRMRPRVHVITDAIADIGPEGDSYRQEWKASGINLISLEELKRELGVPD
jgi:nicotinamidase/pyrazinamidase